MFNMCAWGEVQTKLAERLRGRYAGFRVSLHTPPTLAVIWNLPQRWLRRRVWQRWMVGHPPGRQLTAQLDSATPPGDKTTHDSCMPPSRARAAAGL